MKICVLIKQVPDSDSAIRISDNRKSIETSGLTLITNEADTYALEEALLLKEKHGGEVVVLSMGGESCLQIIKDALAKGADRGIHLDHEGKSEFDILTTAKYIFEIIKDKEFDLVLSGLQSDDTSNAQLGVILSEYMNASHASLVMGTEMISESVIKVKQELEGGWYQWSELDLPASITIQTGLNKPRYASLRGIMMMKKKPIDSVKISDLETIESKSHVHKLYVPEKTKETVFLQGSPDEIIDELMDKLSNDIKVI